MPMRKKSLQRIIDRVGGQPAVARELDVAQQTVSWWLNNHVPAKWVPALVKLDAKHGGNTRPNQIRPDIYVELRAEFR